MGVSTQGAALIYVVLLYKRQQQHSINVADVQVLNLGWDAITLCCVPRWTPGVQVRLHPWCYDVWKGNQKTSHRQQVLQCEGSNRALSNRISAGKC